MDRLLPVPAPLFSVVITTYNREDIVRRCVDSCLAQSCGDFQLVVVDDASADGTVAALGRYDDDRLEVVVHDVNRGISAARNSGVAQARGEWVVVVDSDWELLPNTLEQLRELIGGLPPGVGVIRSQLRWDDGRVTPRFMPAEPIGYEGRIRWVEEEGGWDAGRCVRREALERVPYIPDRRGAMEGLWELDLAREETTLCVEEVLGLEHDDAPNSWLRSASSAELIPRLMAEAPDMLWMAETLLDRHGEALRRWGPRQYATYLRVASMQAFLLGMRRRGAGFALRSLRVRPLEPQLWSTLLLGLVGPGAAARGTLALRRLRALRS
jgi:glycosyltransferase involved in cell wall biosynthesis